MTLPVKPLEMVVQSPTDEKRKEATRMFKDQ